MYEHFDKALTRRFDALINFDRYTQSDLLEIGESILNRYLDKIPYPEELSNLIKTSVAFSDPHDPEDYLRRSYHVVTDNEIYDLPKLKELKFTQREITILFDKSKIAKDMDYKYKLTIKKIDRFSFNKQLLNED